MLLSNKSQSIQQNSDDRSHCFHVVFHELGWVPDGHDIAMDLNISSDRTEVTCSVGGQCAKCTPQNETILLNVEGKYYSFFQFDLFLPLFWQKHMIVVNNTQNVKNDLNMCNGDTFHTIVLHILWIYLNRYKYNQCKWWHWFRKLSKNVWQSRQLRHGTSQCCPLWLCTVNSAT